MTPLQFVLPVLIVLFSSSPLCQAVGKSEGHWSPWGEATPCSVSCGSGVRELRRVWVPAPGHESADGKVFTSSRTFYCTNEDMPHCPINGTWSGWGAWADCSKVCGGGTRKRHRDCYGKLYGGGDCPGEKQEHEDCNREPCPALPRNFDMSQCTEQGNFTCASKRMCIPKKGRCNQKVECHDGSDETGCPKRVRLGASRVRYDLGNVATSVHGLRSIATCSLITLVMVVVAKLIANEV